MPSVSSLSHRALCQLAAPSWPLPAVSPPPAIVRPKAPDTVNIGFFGSARPAMIAKGLGWFQDAVKSKVIWTEVGGGAEINSAFAAGTVDIAIGIGSLPAASE